MKSLSCEEYQGNVQPLDDRYASIFARGVESIGGSYYLLDLTALGRQEDWELPQGRSQDVRSNQPDFAS